MTPDITTALAEIANRPPASWRVLLGRKFPDDPSLVQQALVWLHANREPDDTPEVDRYQLGVMLDGGATAAVWQAHDRKLGRNVAIKLFRIERSPSLEEILAEARAACDIISDHVVRVFDVHDDDPPYIVMELVGEHEPRRGALAPGASAANLRPSSPTEAVRWVREVALGVHDAHLRNVFHRDLKPHNVLITPVSRRARIGDFGLAISSAGAAGTAVGLVRTGPKGQVRVAGTPEYMSPEQARGLPLVLDPRDADDRATLVGVDVWGIGAIAYDLLEGHSPWRASERLEAWEVAATSSAPPTLDRSIPRRLRRIVTKALAPDAAARYATAKDLANELDAYLARRPTSLDRSRATRAWLWTRRNPQLTVTIMLAVVLAIFTAIAYTTVADVRHQRNDLAVEIDHARAERIDLEQRAAKLHSELAENQTNLDALHKTLDDAKQDYDSIVAAKERALDKADAMTRNLADQLTAMRNEKAAAEKGRQLYEGFWSRARAEADQLGRDRNEAQLERDAARKERDQAAKERDASHDARVIAEKERDQARSDRERADQSRRRTEQDMARLAAELAQMANLTKKQPPGRPGSTTPPTGKPTAGATLSPTGRDLAKAPVPHDAGVPTDAARPAVDAGHPAIDTSHPPPVDGSLEPFDDEE